MTKATVENSLNLGLYTPAEAAYYGEIAIGSVFRWLYRYKNSSPVLTPRLGDNERVVTFWDFIQLYIIDRAREGGISLQKIRNAIRSAERSGISYPLARKNVHVIFARELHIGDSERDVAQFTGKHPGQMLLHEIAKPYSQRISFDRDGLAQTFIVFSAFNRDVRMDPRFEFGTPLVSSTGFPSYVLANAIDAEGSVYRAAQAYGVDEEDIRVAKSFHDRLDEAA